MPSARSICLRHRADRKSTLQPAAYVLRARLACLCALVGIVVSGCDSSSVVDNDGDGEASERVAQSETQFATEFGGTPDDALPAIELERDLSQADHELLKGRRRGHHDHDRHDRPATFPEEFRTIDGSNNNADEPFWGSAGETFLRLTTVAYEDGASAPSGADRPSVRAISNAVVAQSVSMPNTEGYSDFVWQWGQFLDHDIDETPLITPAEPFDILVPVGDPFFDPFGTGSEVIPLSRSLYETVDGVRQQVNALTAYIDASHVYGSDEDRAAALRTLDGTGRMRTSDGDLLPFNTDGIPNAGGPAASLFAAGDVRANEQIALTAMHTLFVREHNHWADEFRADDPSLTGDEIYERARAVVAAEMQVITYNEFLPTVLGRDALSRYRGYDPRVNAGIANVFATAAFRLGHSLLSPEFLRLDAAGAPIPAGNIALANAFFNPDAIIETGIDPLLRGLAVQPAQIVDNMIVDGLRNFLFGPPGSGGFDLASLNIQRGRDHGLPSYNQIRVDYGLAPVASFDQISDDPEVQARLASVYASVDDIDAWVGGLSETHVPGAIVGETWFRILRDQFERLRDGDRFWYQRYLPNDLLEVVERTRLADVIRRNTTIDAEIPDDVFHVE